MTIAKYLTGTLCVLSMMNFQAIGMPKNESNEVSIKFQEPTVEYVSVQSTGIDTRDEVQEMISDMKYQLLCAQNEIEKLQETNYQLKNNLTTKEQQIKELAQSSRSNQEVITTLNVKDNEIDKLKMLVTTYEQKIENLAQINNSKATILNTKDDKISELKALAVNYQQQVEGLTSQLTNITNELNKTKENYLTYSQKNTQLISDNMKLHESYLDLQSKITSLQSKVEENQNAYERAAESYKDQEPYLKAVDYLKKDKNNAAIFYFNLAKVYQDNKNYQKTIENYNIALEMNPNFAEAYRELGIAYAEYGSFKNSVKTLNTYLKYSNNPKEEQLIRNFISKIEKAVQG
ncbi:MAG: hypothetical protein ACD_20C00052G0001 [uncultured bacterium]|nr:MAG: hypothetical protein ACD_20C00052G0001 [uncultured bacterium]HBH18339.1 hypothetical protein [Cyanobacteria bacterium UBA9579]